jgi:hypothetical protein
MDKNIYQNRIPLVFECCDFDSFSYNNHNTYDKLKSIDVVDNKHMSTCVQELCHTHPNRSVALQI